MVWPLTAAACAGVVEPGLAEGETLAASVDVGPESGFAGVVGEGRGVGRAEADGWGLGDAGDSRLGVAEGWGVGEPGGPAGGEPLGPALESTPRTGAIPPDSSAS